MSQYLQNISIAKDKLASAGEKLRDSQIILIALGGLGPEYKLFVTSITTRFDHSMSFTQLQQLLMDYDLQEKQSAIVEANMVNKSTKSEEKNIGTISQSQPCQICSRKGHGTINCFNRANFIRFPPTHNRKLVLIDVGNPNTPLANLVASGRNVVAMWYPDSRATSHITANGKLLNSSPYSSRTKVLAANGEPMEIAESSNCRVSHKGTDFNMEDVL